MFLPIRFLFSLAILCATTGCEIDRVLTIKPDGSGQIHERYLGSRDGKTLEPPAGDLFGEGVKLANVKRIEDKNMLGYEADYTFADVTKIRADAFLPQLASRELSAETAGPPDTSRNFQFTKGEVSELRIPLKSAQPKDPKAPTPAEPSKEDPKQRAAFIETIKGLNLRMAIHVQGKIEETNSHFRQGNEVIVNEMNIKAMAADPKHAQEFADAASGKTSPTEPPKDDRYIKKEDMDVLTIRFR